MDATIVLDDNSRHDGEVQKIVEQRNNARPNRVDYTFAIHFEDCTKQFSTNRYAMLIISDGASSEVHSFEVECTGIPSMVHANWRAYDFPSSTNRIEDVRDADS